MKVINVEVEDFFYRELENYSQLNEKNFSMFVIECLKNGFYFFKNESEEKSARQEIEEWKLERGFGKYGKYRALSRFVR